MKWHSSLVASLLLLHLLFCIAQGIRLEKGFLLMEQDQNNHVKEGVLTNKIAHGKASDDGVEENLKNRRSNSAGEEDSYAEVIDYAPSHATPPIHN